MSVAVGRGMKVERGERERRDGARQVMTHENSLTNLSAQKVMTPSASWIQSRSELFLFSQMKKRIALSRP